MQRGQLPLPWENLGLCVAADIANGLPYDPAVVEADAKYLVNIAKINYFRVSSAGWTWIRGNQSLIDRFRDIAQVYLNLGANVQFVLGGSFDHNSPHLIHEDYLDYITDSAIWAESVGIQRLQLENELELGNYGQMTNTQCRDYVLSLPAVARAAGYTGQLTYSLAGGVYAFTNKGDYDDLGVNGYVHYNGSNGVQSAFNAFANTIGIDNSYVSEWGAYLNLYTTDPEVQRREMMKLLNYLRGKFSVPCYMFAWKWVSDNFAARTLTGDTRRFWYDITNQRPPITKYTHDFIHLVRPQSGVFDIKRLGGKALWLKADEGVYSDANGTPCVNDTTVYQWTDFSGMGNHAIQTTDYKRPHFYTNIQNGLPMIFNNGADYNQLDCLNPSNFNIETPTIFVVGRINNGYNFFGKGDSALWPAASFRKLQFGALSGKATFRSGTDTQYIQAVATMNNFNIFMIKGERSNYTNLNVNGVDNIIVPGIGIDLRSYNSVSLKIGAGFANGAEASVCDIAEIIMFNWVLPKYHYRNVINYLSVKWGIAVTNEVPAVIPNRGVAVDRPAL